MVYFALRNLEGKVAMKLRKSERGQSMLLFAVLLPIMTLFLLGILDYMVTNARVMETVAAADLAAHAGAQEITVLPNGIITANTRGNSIAASYFNSQVPPYAHLSRISCGRHQGRPACMVQAQVKSAGYLLPSRPVTVNAIGYLAHGITRGDQ
ncbi:MAG: pilus assembly protein TadG-related protein [Chloroflexota bacterium]